MSPTTIWSPTYKEKPDKNIAELLVADGRFTTLVTLVTEADLLPALEGEEPLAVFAPTDEAFEALNLPPDTDADVVKSVLLYHVAEGMVPIEDGKMVTMLNGQDVLLTAKQEMLKVNYANILEKAEASNGLVYVIDAVLIPPETKPDDDGYEDEMEPEDDEEIIDMPVREPKPEPDGPLAPVDFRI